MRICDFCCSTDRVSQCYISLGRQLIRKYDHLDDQERIIATVHSNTEATRPEICLSCRSEVAKRISDLMYDVKMRALVKSVECPSSASREEVKT